jgi:lipid-binding SYLF domain-containing protein
LAGGERAVTTTSKDPVVGFVFDAKGLIADISLKGAKFSKVDKKNSLCTPNRFEKKIEVF